VLDALSDKEHYLLPELKRAALKALLNRAAKSGVFMRVCRGIYVNPRAAYPRGLVLYHTASKLRAGNSWSCHSGYENNTTSP